MTTTKANGLLLLAGAIWGMGFVAQRTAMDDMPPLLFIGCRFLLAGCAVLPWALREAASQRSAFKLAKLRQFCIVGIVFFGGLALQQVGLMGTTVTNAGFLTSLYVIIVPVLLAGLLRQPQPRLVWPSAVMSLIGVYLLSLGGLSGLTHSDVLIIAGAAVWAVHVILVGSMSRKSALPVSMACTQFFVCSLLGFATHAMAAAWGMQAVTRDAVGWLGAIPEVLYAGIVSGGIAFTLQAIGQRYTNASVAAILMASESLFAAVLGAALLGERLTATGYLGCGLIFTSIVTVESIRASRETAKRKRGISPANSS